MKTVNMTEDEKYYYDNTEYVDERWSDYISYKDWGSGEDRTTITDDMFWQFVQELADKEKEESIINNKETL